MKVATYPEERMIYIELVEGATSVDSQELSSGVVVDYDDAGQAIGIELDMCSIPGLQPLLKVHSDA